MEQKPRSKQRNKNQNLVKNAESDSSTHTAREDIENGLEMEKSRREK